MSPRNLTAGLCRRLPCGFDCFQTRERSSGSSNMSRPGCVTSWEILPCDRPFSRLQLPSRASPTLGRHGRRDRAKVGHFITASQTWNDAPDDARPVWIAWMNNWQHANEIPTTLSMRRQERSSPMTGSSSLPTRFSRARPAEVSACSRPAARPVCALWRLGNCGRSLNSWNQHSYLRGWNLPSEMCGGFRFRMGNTMCRRDTPSPAVFRSHFHGSRSQNSGNRCCSG